MQDVLVITAHEAGEDRSGLRCSVLGRQYTVHAIVYSPVGVCCLPGKVCCHMPQLSGGFQSYKENSLQACSDLGRCRAESICRILKDKHTMDLLLAHRCSPKETITSMREAVQEMHLPRNVIFKDRLLEFAERERSYKTLIRQRAVPFFVEFPSYWLSD